MSNGTTLNISNMSNSEIAQLDADDIANLNNQDLVSFTAEQISHITLDAMSGLTGAQINILSSHPDLIGAFSPEQISHLNAPVNGTTTDYSLMQQAMEYLSSYPETVEDFTDADMSFFTPEAVSWFPAGFVAELPAETFAGFTADQISNLSPTHFREHYAGPDINISPEQISHITLDAMSGLTSAHLSAAGVSSGTLIGAFSPEQISHLNAPVNGTTTDYSLMQQAMEYLSSYPETVEDFTDADMSFFTPEAVSWFPAGFVAELPAETFAGFTADQISNLSSTHFREHYAGPDINISPEQISHITLDAMSGLTSAHLSAAGVSSGTLIGAFSPEQISHLNAPVNGTTTDYSLMQQAMEYLSSYPETVEDFTDADMSFFTPEAVSWFPAGFVAELPAETFAGFTADQISNLSPTHFREHYAGPDINISPEQISHITLDAMSGLTSAHLSAAGVSSGTLIGAFSPEQISHLNAPVNGTTTDYSLMQQAMEYLSSYPETVEDFTDADMSFFTPEAVSWFPAGFVAELPAETFAGFTADQISNLSSTHFREHYAGPDINISPEQISHITLDAMSGLTSAHLSAAGVSSGTLIGAFSPEQISHLNAPVNGTTTDYSLMQQAMEYLSSYPETVEDFTDADMSFFTPEAVSWFPAGFVAELPAETFAGFTADQISNLSPTHFREHYAGPDINISPEQISHITLDAMAGLNLAQATELSQSGELLTALSEEQIFNLQPDCQTLIETALENYLAAQEAAQAAAEDAAEENLSEPTPEEEPASEQAASEEVIDESSSEPTPEEEPASEQAASEEVIDESSSEPTPEEEPASEQAASEEVIDESSSEPTPEEEPASEQAASEEVIDESSSEPTPEEEPASEQAASEEVIDESSSEPTPEEEPASEQAASEEVIDESSSEPASEEEPAPERSAAEEVVQEREREPASEEEPAPEQGAAEEVVEETSSEPASEEEPAPERSAAEEVVQEREREPASEEGSNDTAMPDNPFSRVIRGREREDQDDGREKTRETRETDKEEQSQWGEKGDALKGVKLKPLDEKEGSAEKYNDPISQAKEKFIDKNEAEHASSSPVNQMETSILAAIDQQMAANMAKDSKQSSKQSDDENSAHDSENQQNENTEI